MTDEWILIGHVARAHGVRGWVRVHLVDEHSTSLDHVKEVALGDVKRVVEIRGMESDSHGYRILLDGIDDRDAAELLRGKPVYVERSKLPALPDDELYVADLVGCTVVDPAGQTLGTVKDVERAGAQELLVLEGGALIPLVDGIVTSVDLEARRIVCDPPEGLLEINR